MFEKFVSNKNKDWEDEKEGKEYKRKDGKWRQDRKNKRNQKRNYNDE